MKTGLNDLMKITLFSNRNNWMHNVPLLIYCIILETFLWLIIKIMSYYSRVLSYVCSL